MFPTKVLDALKAFTQAFLAIFHATSEIFANQAHFPEG